MGANPATMINGSRYHTTLCYAKVFKNRTVSPQEIADCLAGSYSRKRTAYADTRSTLKKLASKGYMVKIAEDQWQITPAGVIQVYDMAEYFKKTRQKMVGFSFMQEMQAELTKCSNNIFEIDFDKPDYEDQILEKIYVRFKETTEKKARQAAVTRAKTPKPAKKKKATRKI